MNIPLRVRHAAIVFIAVSPLMASAQYSQFQPPTLEELKMTNDPMAPGAAAVYLNIEQNSDDNLGSMNFYARIKVLTEQGNALARIEIPHLANRHVTAIKGRTIHSDGTIIPLEVKPEDLLPTQSGNAQSGNVKVEQEVFTLPDVEVGSILEYRYDIESPRNTVSSPAWAVQRDYFVHKERFSFFPLKPFLTGTLSSANVNGHTRLAPLNPPPVLRTHAFAIQRNGHFLDRVAWQENLPQGQAVKQGPTGKFVLDLSDIPSRPDADWMPPVNSVLYKVSFYYKSSSQTTDEFWQEEAKLWSKEVDRLAEVSTTIQSAVGGLVSSSDSDLVKARKLYNAVQALDNSAFSRSTAAPVGKISAARQAPQPVPQQADTTWNQKSGNREEIAILYLALLRAAGLNAYAMKVVDRNRGVYDPNYLDANQFDDTLVILSAGGKDILLDPGEKMCSFETVSWRHSMTAGMRQFPNGSSGFTATPEQTYTDNVLTRTADLNLDEHGRLSGQINYVMAGQQALYWRQESLRSGGPNNGADLNKEFDRNLAGEVPDGIEAHVDHFLGLDTPDTNLIAIVNVSGPSVQESPRAAAANRLTLPGFFFESRTHEPFVKEEKRQIAVDMHYGNRVVDQVTYTLPPGMQVEGVPQDATETWAGQAQYIVKTVSSPGRIVITRLSAHAFTTLKPADYAGLSSFYQKLDKTEQQQLVLLETP